MTEKVEMSIEQLADLYVKAVGETDQDQIADGWTVQEIIIDFYAWLTDDVEDSWEDKLQEGFKPGEIIAIQALLTPTGKSNFAAQLFDPHTTLADELFDDTPNITGLGDVIPDDEYIENWDMPSNEEINKVDVADWAAQRREYIRRLRIDSAWGYLTAVKRQEDSDVE